MTIQKLLIGATATFVFAVNAAAQAENLQVKKGKNIGTGTTAESRELADGRSYLALSERWIITTENPIWPVNDSTIDCNASCTMEADGSNGTCIGFCGGVDKDGDLFTFLWDGWVDGSWQWGDGTGKFAGAFGGGRWAAGDTGDPEISLSLWDGTVELK